MYLLHIEYQRASFYYQSEGTFAKGDQSSWSSGLYSIGVGLRCGLKFEARLGQVRVRVGRGESEIQVQVCGGRCVWSRETVFLLEKQKRTPASL